MAGVYRFRLMGKRTANKRGKGGAGGGAGAAKSKRSAVARSRASAGFTATDLLTVFDLSAAELDDVLTLAMKLKLKRRPVSAASALKGCSTILVFEKASLRTRVSFEVGTTRLGGNAVYYQMQDSRIGERESIKDFAMNLDRMVDCIVARVYSQRALEEMARFSSVPVINALSDEHHPCQALADVLTLRERFGALRGLKVCYVGDGNNVAVSLMQACALSGAEFTLLTPAEYSVDGEAVYDASMVAKDRGGSVRVEQDPAKVRNQAAIYTDTWVSMHQTHDLKKVELMRPYKVTAELMGNVCAADGVFMHCLPAHRGIEVTSEVIDGDRSVVYDQAENRVWAQMAVMMRLMGRG